MNKNEKERKNLGCNGHKDVMLFLFTNNNQYANRLTLTPTEKKIVKRKSKKDE